MTEQKDATIPAKAHLKHLVSTALSQSELSGLSNMLRCIAESVGGYGCILWVAPAELKAVKDRSSQFLFVLGQWMSDPQIAVLHKINTYESATGRAVRTQSVVNIGNIHEEDSGVFNDSRFFSQTGIVSMCSIPINPRPDVQGALNIYRTSPGKFDEEELDRIQEMLSLFPALYQTVSDKVSLDIIGKVNEYLHRAELLAPDRPLSKTQVKRILGLICRFISESFQCYETSIFLEDRIESPGLFEVMATTWPVKPIKKPSYNLGLNEGLTGWVLDNKKAVKIFDLAYFEQTKEVIRREYKGITWGDPLNLMTGVRDFLKPEFINEEQPPLSFIAAPIVKGKSVRGVIRCCVTKRSPYYFTDAELRILELVGAQISRFWSTWLDRREMRDENESWRALVTSVVELNHFVHNELKNELPNEDRIFDRALQLITSVISGAENVDVRLVRVKEGKRELYFHSKYGEAWKTGDTKRFETRTFPIDDPERRSAGAEVFQSGEPRFIPDVAADPIYSATFPDVKRMLIVPISIERENYGVLDIRGTGERRFPPYALDIAVLLGEQLGLYRYLAKQVGELKNVLGELKRVQRREIQIYQDLEHQLAHPVILAHARVQSVLRKMVNDERTSVEEKKLQASLWPVRGLCGKAMRVTLSTWLFVNLSQKKPIQPNSEALEHDELIKRLIEAAVDNELLIDPDRKIRIEVDRKSFEVLRSLNVSIDHGLFEQCIGNLLDNACKYSYDHTVVRIYGGLTTTRRFHVSVINKGIPIRPHEVVHCIEREWRGEQAKWVSSDGSGIGLWIVDAIMKAHGGELVITPTTDKLTDIKLVFPRG
jgi:signal transduction histidine kinase